jgi:hypothetical protein
MQSQLQQVAQATMQAKDWYSVIVSAAAVVLSAFGAAGLTLYWQRRAEKRNAKLNVFLTLMMHRKAEPPNQAWVNALNMVDVVFYDSPNVVQSWHKLYPILLDETKTHSEERTHTYIQMLSEMAGDLRYRKLQQVDIDKFYSPLVYAQQAELNAQFQNEIMSFFRTAGSTIQQKQGETVQPRIEIGIATPEENMYVPGKQDVIGYVYPSAANVQVLVHSGNGLWYPQGQIKRDEGIWRVLASIGDDKSEGDSFEIVAIVSATKVNQPIRDIPGDAIVSRTITVFRNPEPRRAAPP